MSDNGDESWEARREAILKEYGLWERYKHHEFSVAGEDDG